MLPIVSRVRGVLKSALLPALAILALTGASTIAQASSLNGTFNIWIYQGAGGGSSGSANAQANLANPLITGAACAGSCLIEFGTYTGDLNFNSAGTNTIDAFLSYSSGSNSFSAGTLDNQLSTSGYGFSTIFVITGTVSGEIIGGTITHDDGVTLYDSTLTAIASSPAPTTVAGTGYGGLTGDWTLVYAAVNNIPEVLNFDVSRQEIITPLPASVWLFGSVLAGSGLFFGRRRKRQSATAA
jgi:hypothetical protein